MSAHRAPRAGAARRAASAPYRAGTTRRPPHWTLGATLAAALAVLAPTMPAAAHEFSLALVAPFSGSRSAEGQAALRGFLIATRERDAHPAETSDGHLGGLDVHVLEVDAAAGADVVGTRIRRLRARQGIEFVVFATGALAAAPAPAGSESSDAPIVIDPASAQLLAERPATAPSVSTLDGERFADVYQAAHGEPAGLPAVRGYVAARLVDAAVRAVGEDFERRKEVEDALAAARRSLR